ncbi:Fructose-1 6-bisphosphatase GlpX type [Paramagnetospirillum magnetotacticum MS-1]|uniref:Fructose-1,6-bisphosphatase n=1 Tax=Paramagnetospirillum magnetotacticum MS-1 TaxID=272627 RepID=A0A0C2UEH1_PARME|nr:class II fructose-bisphosphatase [Paramagnetospirillum magnetotacticum]KIL99902.1 Fructose-1 6-bisphosphatase GlpX type [Paramagnetospirillum magnetotacticum MS-1]
MSERSKTVGAYELRRATEAAARAAYAWIGRGDKALADDAAVAAMQTELDGLDLNGLMLIGEGPKDEIGMLYHGQRFGAATAEPAWDLVVDPLEGTSFLAKGMTNAMAVVAMAPHGTLFDPAPARYMEKLAAPPAAKGKIDPKAPVAERLAQLSAALNKPIEDITVYVIEKPRHKALVNAIHNAGARVALYPAGDVAGALMAAIPGSGIDALMGTGGTPEGLLSAMAIRAMGGEFLGRIDPQLATEAAAVEEAGMDLNHWYQLDEMVRSDKVVFCATGITTGLLLDGVERTRDQEKTQTLMIGGAAGPRQMLTSWHRRA